MNKIYRQGELLLVPTQKPNTECVSEKDYIVSHSETGHHHLLLGMVDVFNLKGKEVIVNLKNDTILKHKKEYDKHNDLKIPAGSYKVINKTEYDPFAETIRKVWD